MQRLPDSTALEFTKKLQIAIDKVWGPGHAFALMVVPLHSIGTTEVGNLMTLTADQFLAVMKAQIPHIEAMLTKGHRVN